MITEAQARALVEVHLQRFVGEEWTPVITLVERFERGWIVYWNAAEPGEMLAGNAPYLVDETTGNVVGTGTAEPVRDYVERYLRFGNPHGPPPPPVVWHLMCDDSHRWEVESESGELPAAAERCPVDGAPAVTAERRPVGDRVRMTLVPAARDDEWRLELTGIDGSAVRSRKSWTWNEAVEKAAFFRGLSWEDAVRRWKRTGLGS